MTLDFVTIIAILFKLHQWPMLLRKMLRRVITCIKGP